MKKHLFIVFLLSAALACNAQVFSCKQGEATFFSEAALENIEAHTKNINSFINLKTREIAFIIPIRGFKFQKSLMQEHFNEKYMESDKYPNATYNGKIDGTSDLTVNGSYPVTSTGKITMHGIEKEITQSGTIKINNGELNLSCSFNVAVNDYGIKIPKLLFQNIADTVLVKINADYIPYQKK